MWGYGKVKFSIYHLTLGTFLKGLPLFWPKAWMLTPLSTCYNFSSFFLFFLSFQLPWLMVSINRIYQLINLEMWCLLIWVTPQFRFLPVHSWKDSSRFVSSWYKGFWLLLLNVWWHQPYVWTGTLQYNPLKSAFACKKYWFYLSWWKLLFLNSYRCLPQLLIQTWGVEILMNFWKITLWKSSR